MPRKKFTTRTIEALKPPPSGRIEYFDTAIPGFGLRITDKGTKSWIIFYRVHGRQRRMTIGSYPKFSLSEAREEARIAFQKVERGVDPAQQKLDGKKGFDHHIFGVEAVVYDFIDKHHRRDQQSRTADEIQRMFEIHLLPHMGNCDIRKIEKRDILVLLDSIAEKTSPVRANRILANFKKFFSWSVERDIIPLSPASGVKSFAKENERDRVLSPNEIRSLWRACDEIGWPFGPFTQMLLVTAQRRDEVAHMRWDEIQDDVWTIPKELTKANRKHEVPLSTLAQDILEQQPHLGSYVFMSGRKPRLSKESTPISGFGKAKNRLDSIAEIDDWRFHDLRRTAGTYMARLQIPVSTISRILNHAEGGVTKIYARYSYVEEKRQALERWSTELTLITEDLNKIVNFS